MNEENSPSIDTQQDEQMADTTSTNEESSENTPHEEIVETIPFEQLPPEEQVAQLLNEKVELENRLLKSLAELDNFRKRSRKEIEEIRKYESMGLARSLLPALSNLRRAITASHADANIESIRSGVEMVAKQFDEALAQKDIKRIPTEGHPFDPNMHDALQMQPSELPAQTVIKELEAGYQLHDRIVQPSKVLVSQGPAETSPSDSEPSE